MRQKVVIADVRSINRNGNVTGHYFTLAKNYIDVLEDEFEVVVAGGPIYKERFKKYLALPFDTDLSASAILNKLKVIANCLVLFCKTKDCKIILQSNAVATTFFSMIISPFKRELYMIQYNTMALDSGIKRMLHKLAKDKIIGVLCPSEEIGRQYTSRYLVIPDYIITEHQVATLAETKDCEKRYDIGIVGIVTPDKGIVQAARCLAKKKYKVLIAGRPVTLEIKKELEEICGNNQNIELRLEYISDDLYDEAIRSSRYCMLNYTDAYSEHSSGVIFDALYRGIPIIGRRCRFLQVVEDQKLGYLYDDIETCDFELLFNTDVNSEYQRNIKEYLIQQLTIKEKLCSFLRCENDRYII